MNENPWFLGTFSEKIKEWLSSRPKVEEERGVGFPDLGRHYILEGRKIKQVSMLEWAKWFESKERIIAQTTLPTGEFISTVFLGIDHNFNFNGDCKPILFESMIFGGAHSDSQWRYASYREAEIGHSQIIEALRRGEEPEVNIDTRSMIDFFKEMFKNDPE